MQKLQDERRLLQERLGSMQHALAQLEAEKREAERSALRLDKDRVALRRTLDKVGCFTKPLSLALGPGWGGSLLCVPTACCLCWCWVIPLSPLCKLPCKPLLPPRWSGRSSAAMRTQCG